MAITKQRATRYSSTTTPDDFCSYWAVHTVENDYPRQYCQVVLKGWVSKQAYLDKVANKDAIIFTWEGEHYPVAPGVEIGPTVVYHKILLDEPGWEDAQVDPAVWA